jgi:short-subunit dehydrogenase
MLKYGGYHMKKSPLFENVTIITGASEGIGRELALQLADKGAWLALAARTASKLDDVTTQCLQRGARAIGIPADVTEESQCEQLIERTVSEYGRIDTLINNAGMSMYSRFDELQDLTILEQIMQVNYFGSVYCTFYALPYLKKTQGRIVGMCSLLGKAGAPTRIGYAASKHAAIGFYDSLRIECSDNGVSVTVICPDFVSTGIRERSLGADAKPLSTSTINEARVMTVERCVELTIGAIIKRKRELIMSMRGKVGLWLKLIAPKLVDRIARNAIEKGR